MGAGAAPINKSGTMERVVKIRRSKEYAIAGVIVLLARQFLPGPTPDWFGVAVSFLVCSLAGVALYCNRSERRPGEAFGSIGFCVLAVLVMIFAVLFVLPLVL